MTQPWRYSCKNSNVQSLNGHEREHQDNAKAAEQTPVGMGTHSSLDTWKMSGGFTEFSANDNPAEAGLNKSGRTLKSLLDEKRGSRGNVQVCSVLSSLSLMFWEQEDEVNGMHSKRYWEVRLSVKSLLETNKQPGDGGHNILPCYRWQRIQTSQ